MVLTGMGGQGTIPLPMPPRSRPTNTVVVAPGHTIITLVTIAMVERMSIFPIRKTVGTGLMPRAVGMLTSSNISATVERHDATNIHLLMVQPVWMSTEMW